jgi:hypothetical protein
MSRGEAVSNNGPGADFEANRPHIDRYLHQDERRGVSPPPEVVLDAEIRLRHARRAGMILLALVTAVALVVFAIRIVIVSNQRAEREAAASVTSRAGLGSSPEPAMPRAFFEPLPGPAPTSVATSSGATLAVDRHLQLGNIVQTVRALAGFVVTGAAGALHETTLVVSSAATLTGTLVAAPGRTCHWTIVGAQSLTMQVLDGEPRSFAAATSGRGSVTLSVRSDGDPARSCAVGAPELVTAASPAKSQSPHAPQPTTSAPSRPPAPSPPVTAGPAESGCPSLDGSVVRLLTGECALFG